jgi:hypothetical protein
MNRIPNEKRDPSQESPGLPTINRNSLPKKIQYIEEKPVLSFPTKAIGTFTWIPRHSTAIPRTTPFFSALFLK